MVIIGAGASHVSGSYNEHERPPLTRKLFSSHVAADLLRTYVLAQSAGETIERAMKEDSTLAFEKALVDLRQDGHAHHLLMSHALPLYLQALLLTYSSLLHARANRYAILVDELLKLSTHVYFVSLNYDTLLDYRLGAYAPITTLESYVASAMNWSLIKPHGSVNWFVKLDRVFDPRAPGTLRVPLDTIECVAVNDFDLGVVRASSKPTTMTRRYPALALPEGPKDELVLPPAHSSHFRRVLRQASEVDVLVLGYSALDTEVLDLIKRHVNRVRRLTVVNRDPAEALSVYDRINEFGISPIWPDTFDGSYEQWIDRDGLRLWVREFGGLPDGPYPSLTSPADLRERLATRHAMSRGRVSAESWLTRPL